MWLGMDSTQVLIVFLIAVFLILVVFLLLYYYVIKGMKQRVTPTQNQKSTSGSMDGEKQRNIFAHPERQLAVDQSTRMNSRSPGQESDSSTPGAVSGQSTPLSQSLILPLQQQVQQQQPQPQIQRSMSTASGVSGVSAASGKSDGSSISSTALQKRSNSGGEKGRTVVANRKPYDERQVSGANVDPENHGTGVLGVLAGIRDTLHETEGHK